MDDIAALDVTPLPTALGAEIGGVDLRQDLSPGAIDAITQALNDHIVVVFPGQELDEEQQIRFTCRFGELGMRKRSSGLHPDGRLMLVSNIMVDGEALGSYGDGDMWFHSDGEYDAAPYKYSLLHALELPSSGGNTRFANLYSAYDAVPPDLKQRLKGRRVLQMGGFRRREKADPTVGLEDKAHAWHPVFTTHPATGRTSLFVSRLHSVALEAMDQEEAEPIIDQLIEISERPDFIYEHTWRPGDVVMWDNRCSNHGRTDFPQEERRLLRRCTVVGEAPRG